MSDFKPVVIINEYLVLQACLEFMEDFIVILPGVINFEGAVMYTKSKESDVSQPCG